MSSTYATRVAAHVCTQCGLEPAAPDRVKCPGCTAGNKLRRGGDGCEVDTGHIGQLVDAATVRKEYTAEETAFMRAVDEYKRRNQRPFPAWHEVLAVLLSLGYRLTAPAGPLPRFWHQREGSP